MLVGWYVTCSFELVPFSFQFLFPECVCAGLLRVSSGHVSHHLPHHPCRSSAKRCSVCHPIPVRHCRIRLVHIRLVQIIIIILLNMFTSVYFSGIHVFDGSIAPSGGSFDQLGLQDWLVRIFFIWNGNGSKKEQHLFLHLHAPYLFLLINI